MLVEYDRNLMGIPVNQLTPRMRAMMDQEPNPWTAPAPCEQTPPNAADAVTNEIALHNAIKDALDLAGWVYFYSAPHRRTGRTLGEPDFHVFGPGGMHWLIECKAKGGVFRPDQSKIRSRLSKLGHKVETVRSMSEFRAITKL